MNKPDRELCDRMTDYLAKSGTRSLSDYTDLFTAITASRGRGAADAWATLYRSYRSRPKSKIKRPDVSADCVRLIENHPAVQSMLWEARATLTLFAVMIVFFIGLILLAIGGYTVPADSKGLIGILVGLIAGGVTYLGSSTATVDAMLPAAKGLKMTIKLSGTAAAIIGAIVLLHNVGY